MTKLNIKSSTRFNGDFVKAKGISKVKIVEEPTNVSFSDDDKDTKVRCKVNYAGYETGNPNEWTLNNSSAEILQIAWKSNESADWVGKIVPIRTEQTKMGRAIYVDEDALEGANPPKTESTQEEL